MIEFYIAAAVIAVLQVCTIYLIWKLLRKNPAVSEQLTVSAANESEAWDKEIIRTIELQCLRIRNAVDRQTERIHYTEMKLAPKKILGSDPRLLANLSKEQQALLEEFYQLFDSYLQTHWYSSHGSLKTVFSGSEDNPASDAGKLVRASAHLRENMDAWFITWRAHV